MLLIFTLFLLLVDDYRIVFERTCPFELNLIDAEVVARVGHEIVSTEDLVVKILVKVSFISWLDHSSVGL